MNHVLHIGVHKTASTWMQHDVFPRLDGIQSTWGDPDIQPLLRAVSHQHDGWDPGPLRDAIAAREGRLLLSSEALGGTHWSTLDAAGIHERLCRVLPDCQVVVWVRDRVELVRSLYVMDVLSGETLPYRRWRTERLQPGRLDLDALVGLWRSTHDVVVLDYGRMHDGELDRMLEFMGVPTPALPDVRRNQSVSDRRLAVQRTWNRVASVVPDDRIQRRMVWGMRRLVQR